MLSILGLMVSTGYAEVRMPAVFSDHMVLQRDQPIAVWGFADPSESVTVTLNKQTQTTTANRDGKWRVTFTAMKAGGPFEMTVKAQNTLNISDILIGEVWLCSGQSNMEQGIRFTLGKNWKQLKEMNHPRMRLLLIPNTLSNTPQDDVKAQWKLCSEKTILQDGWGGFSAVGYHFGKVLLDELDVPVGLIQSSVGGTPIEVWMSDADVKAVPEAKPILDKWATKVRQYKPQYAQKRYEKALAQWQVKAKASEKQGKKTPPKPQTPTPPNLQSWYPSTRYNTMIWPIIPYCMRGILWYQGYANRHNTVAYQSMFHRLIHSWRQSWGKPDLPFYFVQHSPLKTKKQSDTDLLANLREAQASALDLPNTAMVVTLDVADPRWIHYGNKKPVGQRLANIALKQTYGKTNLQPYSPLYDHLSTQNDQTVIHFKHADHGLMTTDNKPVGGFEIAGSDQQFVPVTADIDGSTVRIKHTQINKPVSIRYAWDNNPKDANLFGKNGLPVAPFRTDNWLLK
tara:strand:- start:334 stop:1866 length:1533 start_codon:yes stop_codon:yes gene_type:complete